MSLAMTPHPSTASLQPDHIRNLRPSWTLRGLMLLCPLATIGQFVAVRWSALAFMAFYTLTPLVIWIAFFVLRAQLRWRQYRMNSNATQIAAGSIFALYLRPFVTSRSLPVPCRASLAIDRWLFGRRWDLELAISLSVPFVQHVVAIGQMRRSFGAAKIITTDDKWQTLVRGLAEKARVIFAVPFDRPGTTWEVLQVVRDPALRYKTVFIMPPTSWARRLFGWILFWRHSHARDWERSQKTLASHGVALPNYTARGALMIRDESAFNLFETCNFNPRYVAAFAQTLIEAEGSGAEGRQKKLAALAEQHRRRRPIIDYIFFFWRPTWWVVTCGVIIGLSVARLLLAEMVDLPSASMEPTLLRGDTVYGARSYGYSTVSLGLTGTHQIGPIHAAGRELAALLPRSPRFWGIEPKRGDLAIFLFDLANNIRYAKRVIGLPGDTILLADGKLTINGDVVRRDVLPSFRSDGDDRTYVILQSFREILPNGVSYDIIDDPNQPGLRSFADTFHVPDGALFVLSDNRSNGIDSRAPSFGYVPIVNLTSQPTRVLFSMQPGASFWRFWEWPQTVRWERIGTRVR
jgi:signal peptidase I